MERDTGGRARDRLICCKGCGVELEPRPPGRRGPDRIWCDNCSTSRRPRIPAEDRPSCCLVCGGPFPPLSPKVRGLGGVRKHCSDKCRREAEKARKSVRSTKKCCRCGVEFVGPSDRKFCSEECRWPSRLRRADCPECKKSFTPSHKSKKYCCAECGKKANKKRLRRRNKTLAKVKTCLCCAKPFFKRNTGRNAGLYCSRECAFEARRLRMLSTTMTRRTGTPLSGQLAMWFHAWGNDIDEPLYRGHKKGGHKHRCIKYGCPYESFTNRSILARDGWRCQLCGVLLLKKYETVGGSERPHPRSPTIDHIVPLSFGPSSPGHVPSNVQACCWDCNSRKSNKPDSFVPLYATPLE